MNASNIPEFKLPQSADGDLQFKLELLDTNSGYNPVKPHRHDFYEVFLFQRGGGIHMIDFNELKIEKEQIHFLSPGQVHFMDRDPKSYGLVIKFTPYFFSSRTNDQHVSTKIPFLHTRIANPIIEPNTEEFKSLLDLAESIKQEFEQKNEGYVDMIKTYLNLILLKCQRLYSHRIPHQLSENNLTTDKFNTLLEDQFLNESRVSFYADQLHISSDKLNQVLKLMLGKSTSEVIADRMLLEAKRLLLHSEKSIKEVAYYLNFQDNAYFNRWFKKLENCSPGEFRSANQEKYNL